jgi:Flp pilus assembly pilin Flp
MLMTIRRFLGENKAATAVEYAIIAAVIGIAAIGAYRFLGDSIRQKTNEAGNAIQNGGR